MNCCHPALFDLKLLDHSFVSYIHYRNNIDGDINVILLLLYSFIWISVLISFNFFFPINRGIIYRIGVYTLLYNLKGENVLLLSQKKIKRARRNLN